MENNYFALLANDVKKLWNGLDDGQKLGMLALIVVTIIAATFFLSKAMEPDWVVLYSDLNEVNALTIVENMKKNGYQYKLSEDKKSVFRSKLTDDEINSNGFNDERTNNGDKIVVRVKESSNNILQITAFGYGKEISDQARDIKHKELLIQKLNSKLESEKITEENYKKSPSADNSYGIKMIEDIFDFLTPDLESVMNNYDFNGYSKGAVGIEQGMSIDFSADILELAGIDVEGGFVHGVAVFLYGDYSGFAFPYWGYETGLGLDAEATTIIESVLNKVKKVVNPKKYAPFSMSLYISKDYSVFSSSSKDVNDVNGFVGEYNYRRSTAQGTIPIPELVVVNVGAELGFSVTYSRMPNKEDKPTWFTVSTETAVTVGVESAPGPSINYSKLIGSGYLEWICAPDKKSKWARIMSWVRVL